MVFRGLPRSNIEDSSVASWRQRSDFFDAFGLDQPRIPLLNPEFTNPLFLKLYCEGLQQAGLRAPSPGENHVSDVFDRYLKSKAARIASRLELDPATRPVEKAIDRFCHALAEDNRDSLERDHSARIVNAFAPGRDRWPDTLLGRLLDEDVLTADVARRQGTAETVAVVRFTYQRFADYRVASVFLKPLSGDPARLREALAPRRPLRKRVLKAPAAWGRGTCCSRPGTIWHGTARRRQLASRFVDAPPVGIGVRAQHLGAATERGGAADAGDAVSRIKALSRNARSRSRRAPDGRSSSGTSVERHSAPEPQGLVDARTRCRLEHPDVLRIREWRSPRSPYTVGGARPYPHCPDRVVELAAVPIVWTFTSPNRRMRDYATKALAQLLAGSLGALPPLIRRFDGVDDPYVIERLAVVAQGAVLRGGRMAEPAAAAVARELRRVALGATQIPNIVTRDAVRGVHEWCVKHGLIDEREYAATLPPYGADPPAKARTEKQLDRAYGGDTCRGTDIRRPYADLFMSIFVLGDFGRYVIESKLRHFSGVRRSSIRRPADRPDLRDATRYPAEPAKCWVFERVLSLGWTPEKFAGFDKARARFGNGRSEHKIERFGKKYQWIALRELVARVADNFWMADDFGARPRTYAGPWQFYGRDIDPDAAADATAAYRA